MSAYTLVEVQEMLSFYKQAEMQVLQGKAMSQNGRTWTREDLPAIRQGRQEWERRLQQLQMNPERRGPAVAEF